jgi:hypothetical protein
VGELGERSDILSIKIAQRENLFPNLPTNEDNQTDGHIFHDDLKKPL